MSQVEVLAGNAVNFDYEFVSCSPSSINATHSKVFTTALVESILSSTQHHTHAQPETHHVEDVDISGLPTLHYGHPEIQLRKGVMRALQLAADGEADAEKAFFVADLSYVFQQHLRWQKLLPEIHPFYGTRSCFLHKTPNSRADAP